MRLLITGSAAHWAIENYYQKYLVPYVTSCDIVNSAGTLEKYLQQGYINKILFRTGLSSIIKRINADLLEQVEKFQPDAVLVFKGIELLPQTLRILKARKVRLFNYNPDHPFIRSFRSGGGKNVEVSVPLYDGHFCYSTELMKEIRHRFDVDTYWLPFAFDMDPIFYNVLKEEPEIQRLCFAGNPDKERAYFLQQLAKAGIQIDVYGHDWKKFLTSGANIQIFDAVYAEEFWKVLRRYRVQLNLFRPHNYGSHNMRTFEVPAAGGIMLAPDTPEHRIFFEPGKEVFLYSSVKDCIAQAKEILGRPLNEIESIRDAARQRSLTEDYSYRRRAHDVYSTINFFLNGNSILQQ